MAAKSLRKNFLMNTFLSMSSFLFPLITFPYISRILMASGLGKINFATSIVNYLLTFAMLGMPLYGVKVCASYLKDRRKLIQTVSELLLINIFVGVVALIILALLTIFIGKFRENWELIAIFSCIIPLNIIGMEWLYKALEEYSYIAVRTMIFKVLGIVLMFAFVHDRTDYLIYAAITVFAGSASYILNFIKALPYLNVRKNEALNLKQHVRPLLSFFLLTVSWTIYTNTDVIMLGFLSTDRQVGYYSASLRIKSIVLSIVGSLSTVILPRVVHYFAEERYEEAKLILRKSSSFIWLSSLYFIGFIIISAEGIITLLSGDGYLLATPTLQATIVTVLFVGLSAFLGTNILVSLGKESVTIRASFVGILINILLNLLLISRLASLGAGIATVVGEASMVLYELLYLGKESYEYFDERNIAKILLVFTATFLITTFIYPSLSVLPIFLRLLVSGGLYSLIYGIGLYLVKENLVVDWVGGLLKRFKNS